MNDLQCAVWRIKSGWWGTPQAHALDTPGKKPCCTSCHNGLCHKGCGSRQLQATTYEVCCKTKALCMKAIR